MNLELWGGHECTINRLGDLYMDQSALSGHYRRLSDIDLFADIGFKALRYPVLWERIAPEQPDCCDWSWTDKVFDKCKARGLRIIAGLVHHGAGPVYASFETSDFVTGLARYARKAAERYDWIQDWTPINEPLTTARFACLYGHWYPHARAARSFWCVMLNQVDAIRAAMREIRSVRSDARLVQTEDLGRVYATPLLQYQANFENVRRFLTWDLLTGKVNRDHPLWRRLAKHGLADRLRAIADDPCPPDIIGVNHYLTSNRFLDHRVERYPGVRVGGNARNNYVDVEAVRVLRPYRAGFEGPLQEAWDRYRIPIALTEVHNGSTREEQVRWFAESYETAQSLRAQGVSIQAVTAWSLLGAYDWQSLLTRPVGRYECGVFDVSSGVPRPTALARHIEALSRGDDQPSVGHGWWTRDVRFTFAPVDVPVNAQIDTGGRGSAPTGTRKPILIVGASGSLGKALMRACVLRDLDFCVPPRSDLDLTKRETIEAILAEQSFSAVINAAGWVRVDDAETAPEACRGVNTFGAVALARACARLHIPFVGFSTDLVFSGTVNRPYIETDHTAPLNVYGRSKADAEKAIMQDSPNALIIRTAAFFSPDDASNFAHWVVRSLLEKRRVKCASDIIVSPTYTPALAHAVLDLLLDQEAGIWHIANQGATSWYEFGCRLAREMKLDEAHIAPVLAADMNWRATRPRSSALSSNRGQLLRDIDDGIGEFARAWRV
jgi:dTDP-4-dehydrorhamnose reductase